MPGFQGNPSLFHGAVAATSSGPTPPSAPANHSQSRPLSESEFYKAQRRIKDISRSPTKKTVDVFDSFADLTNSRSRSREKHRR